MVVSLAEGMIHSFITMIRSYIKLAGAALEFVR